MSNKLHWWKDKHLKTIEDFGKEMEKWSVYLQHQAKLGDQQEVNKCIEKIEELFTRTKGG
tara:strand:- start:163 stop:342 length:180 start_codon:yes stop_codon:yes gene_type:complete